MDGDRLSHSNASSSVPSRANEPKEEPEAAGVPVVMGISPENGQATPRSVPESSKTEQPHENELKGESEAAGGPVVIGTSPDCQLDECENGQATPPSVPEPSKTGRLHGSEPKGESEAAGGSVVIGTSPDYQLDECENGQATPPSVPEPTETGRLNEDPKTIDGDNGAGVSSGNMVHVGDNENKRCTSCCQRKYIRWTVLALLVFCSGVVLLTNRIRTDATTQTGKQPPAEASDQEINHDDGKTDPTLIPSLTSAPNTTTAQVLISAPSAAPNHLQLQGMFDFVEQIDAPPSRTQIPPPTRAPVSPPTRAPVNPPTQAPVSPPTRSPVSLPTQAPVSPTQAPVSPPTLAPVNPPTQAPVSPPTQAPVTRAPVSPPTQAPVSPPTRAPVSPPTLTPVSPPTRAPVSPPSQAPVSPPTRAPVSPPTQEPVSPPTRAPVSPPTQAPVSPPTRAPVSPPTRVPVSPPTRTPVSPPTQASVRPPTRAPVTPPTLAPTPQILQWKDFKGLLINVGSSRTQNDSRGNQWVSDVGGDVRSTGTIVGSSNCAKGIGNTAIDDNLFCTGRVAQPQIRVQKIPRGSYVVTFHFTYPTNVRKEFEVTINNIRVYKELPALPIEPFTAQSVDASVEVSQGFLQIDFWRLQSEPYITAVEVHKANSQFGAPKTNLEYLPGVLTVKESGLILSEGLTARRIATTDQRVIYVNGGRSLEKFHEAPDAGATFVDTRPGNQGGWVYVSNSEVKPDGGVGAITFNRRGDVIDYRRLLSNTRDNCGGGRTPWNTWISCEETSGGRIYQVDPLGIREPERITMGETDTGDFESFAHDIRNTTAPRFFATKDDDRGELRRL